jgi:hypothetical protein
MYCEFQGRDCPKLAEGETYKGVVTEREFLEFCSSSGDAEFMPDMPNHCPAEELILKYGAFLSLLAAFNFRVIDTTPTMLPSSQQDEI